MAYYTGQASNFDDLLSALVTSCQTQGWVYSAGILSKNNVYFKLSSHETDGIYLSASDTVNSSELVDSEVVRLGRYGAFNTQPTFPMDWELHIHSEPDEVYFLTKFSINKYYYLAFGVDVGFWLAACCGSHVGYHEGNGASISSNSQDLSNGRTQNCGFFWGNNGIRPELRNSAYFSNGQWRYPQASKSIDNLLSILPNQFNQESILLPVQVYEEVASNKSRFIHNFEHVRLLRIDNYEPEQIITLGHERWKIYPFYQKNSAQRQGGGGIQHSGTFGWAIRYDGP